MSTRTLPDPAQLKRELRYKLPREVHAIHVTPRDEQGRKCAAWCARNYEISAFYAFTGDALGPLEEALKAVPGVYRTTQVDTGGQAREPDWPGFARRYNPSYNPLRPQVLALIADPGDA